MTILDPRPVVVCVALLAMFAGCDSRGPTVEVSGKVTLDGAPFSQGSVWFTSPRSGSGFRANLREDGTFVVRVLEVKYGEVYGVHISGRQLEAGETPAKLDAGGNPLIPSPPVPRRYQEYSSSGLTAKIDRDGARHFVFDLKSK